MLQFCPAPGRSASHGYKSLLLHLYHLDVLQKYPQEKQQLRLVAADSSSRIDGLVDSMLNEHSDLYNFICEEIFHKCATLDALVHIWVYECTNVMHVLRL